MADDSRRRAGEVVLKFAIVPCTLKKANDFVQINHRHSIRTSRDGGKFAIAASVSGDIVGVAIVGNPLSATFMDGFTAEVLRVCVIPGAPRNCNSFLYGACRRIWFEMGGVKIITYTLTEETGVSLRGAGWTLAATVKGHSAATWGKNDHLQRTNQPILEKEKRRWEAINSAASAHTLKWPDKVAFIREGPLFEEDGHEADYRR